MTTNVYKGHVFNQKPLTQHWRRARYDLGNAITPEMRERAAKLSSQEWALDRIVDQGATPHCVGMAWATWGNCQPIDDNYGEKDGHAIYYEAVAIGGYPNSEDGAETEWGVRAMLARRRTDKYAWASSIDDMVTWLLVNGPLVTGLLWTVGMADPDTDGVMHSTGYTIGGHETTWVGVDKNTGLFKMANSWGTSWANGGFSYFSFDDMAKTLDNLGDCCTTVELPLEPTPQPSGCAAFLGALKVAQKKLKSAKNPNQAEIQALQLAINYLKKK